MYTKSDMNMMNHRGVFKNLTRQNTQNPNSPPVGHGWSNVYYKCVQLQETHVYQIWCVYMKLYVSHKNQFQMMEE